MKATRPNSYVFSGAMIAAIATGLLLESTIVFAQQSNEKEKEDQTSEQATSAEPEEEEPVEGDVEADETDQAEPKLPDLQTMIAVALEHNPDIRAARAKVEMAQAELDRTRLGVIQKITTYRQRYNAQKKALIAAEQQLESVKEQYEKGIMSQSDVLRAQEKVAAMQSQLAGLQAELPFLLGRSAEVFDADGDKETQTDANTPTSRRTRFLKETIRPKLKELLNTTIEDFRAGNAGLREFYDWSRRLVEIEQQLANNKAERIAAIEAHRDRMQQILEALEPLLKVGQPRERELRITQFYVEEAKLWLMEERGEE